MWLKLYEIAVVVCQIYVFVKPAQSGKDKRFGIDYNNK